MDPVQIVNRALGRIGAQSIPSLEAPGPAGDAPKEIYEGVVDDLLSRNRWSFGRKVAKLTRLAGDPERAWDHRFLLPGDRTGPPEAFWDDARFRAPLLAYELVGKFVFADAEELWVRYPWRPPPLEWPAYFRELVVLACAAELALAIREDQRLRTLLREEVYGPPSMAGEGGLFADCCSRDAGSSPSPQPAGGRNPVVDARWLGDAREGW